MDIKIFLLKIKEVLKTASYQKNHLSVISQALVEEYDQNQNENENEKEKEKEKNNFQKGLNITQDFNQSELLQLSLSSLAAWPVYLVLTLIYFNPWRYQFGLHKLMSLENPFMQMLYGSYIYEFIFLSFILLVINVLLKIEIVLISLIAILVAQTDLHIYLALIALIFILAQRWVQDFINLKKLQGYKRNSYFSYSLFKFLTWIFSAFTCFEIYNYLLFNQFYSASMNVNRLESFLIFVTVFYSLEFICSMTWGHFKAQKSNSIGKKHHSKFL